MTTKEYEQLLKMPHDPQVVREHQITDGRVITALQVPDHMLEKMDEAHRLIREVVQECVDANVWTFVNDRTKSIAWNGFEIIRRGGYC